MSIKFNVDVMCEEEQRFNILIMIRDLGCLGLFIFPEHINGVTLRIIAPYEFLAFEILNYVFGPDNGTRDSNKFLIYGEDK